MKNFNLKNYGINDLSKESFEIRKIIINRNDYHYDENNKIQYKILSFKRYIVINKETNQQLMINNEYKYYRTFKKALLAVLRFQGRIVEINKCAKFYNYVQDEKSIEDYHKEDTYHNDIMSDYCFIGLLQYHNGHMSKAIRKYIHLIDEDPEFGYSNYTSDYIKELIWYQIPHRYYKDEYFIKNIPKYAKLMSKEFYYTKKGEENYGKEITNELKKEFKEYENYYKKLLYDMVEEIKGEK